MDAFGDPQRAAEIEVLNELREREPIFHRESRGSDREVFEGMTSADYWEVGISGQVHERQAIVETVVDRYASGGVDQREQSDAWTMADFAVRNLAEGTWLATYLLGQGDVWSRRSTIWARNASGWVAVYHQGTLVEQVDTHDHRGEVELGLIRPNGVSYLHIPAVDASATARFYGEVFGWRIDNPESDRPSFSDGTGHVAGAWMTSQAVSLEPGLLPYIYVADIESSASRVAEHGGELVSGPLAEGDLQIATFRDPSGNLMGLWQAP
jgi:predicted enzyme related to lactoylglutathione lyase